MIGKKIAQRRKALGLTQVQLAAALGVSANTVARWERDEMTPTHNMVELSLWALQKQKA